MVNSSPTLPSVPATEFWSMFWQLQLEISVLSLFLWKFPMKAKFSQHQFPPIQLHKEDQQETRLYLPQAMPQHVAFQRTKAEENKNWWTVLKSREDWPLPEPLQHILLWYVKWGKTQSQDFILKQIQRKWFHTSRGSLSTVDLKAQEKSHCSVKEYF